jgi:MFS family permease
MMMKNLDNTSESVKFESKNNNKKIISWLAHHNPKRDDFKNHVFYLFNYAICIGCFAFVLGTVIALILGNLFYSFILNIISFPIILIVFFICWIPSILQYSVQILRKKPVNSRVIKFLIRFLYPLGSIIFIFKSPILGFALAVPAGYFIVYIRRIKERALGKK